MVPYHTFVGAEQAPRWGVLMHGVLGAGHNLRSFAKRLVERRSDYRFALLDLRYHGRSLGAPGPHGLSSCVDDLFDLVHSWNRAPQVVMGHSMGGKIALGYARRHEAPQMTERRPEDHHRAVLEQIWTLDSDPGAQIPDESHEVEKVMAALRAHPGPFASRGEAIESLTSEGHSSGLAHWLAASLDRKPEGLTWRYELNHIELLLKDYFSIDEWPFLETMDERHDLQVQYDLLVAENSDRWSGSMKERARGIANSTRIRSHELKNAGHWVHVDNPDGLLDIVSEHLK